MKYAFLFSIPFFIIIACSSNRNSTSQNKKKNFQIKRSLNFTQVLEGRISHIAKIFVLGGKNVTENNYESAVSGIRTYSKNHVSDVFKNIKIIKGKPIIKSEDFIKFDFKDQSGKIRTLFDSNSKFRTQLESIYRLVHTLPDKTTIKNNSWTITDVKEVSILGKLIKIKRVFSYTVLPSEEDSNTIKIKGKYVAESLKPLSVKGFEIEIVGKGDSEAEFNLKNGVWSHIKAKLIQGWIGSTIKENREVTTGYQVITSVNLYFTRKNNGAYQN